MKFLSNHVAHEKLMVVSCDDRLLVKTNQNESLQWKKENARQIAAYNQFVEQNDAFSDSVRKF